MPILKLQEIKFKVKTETFTDPFQFYIHYNDNYFNARIISNEHAHLPPSLIIKAG